MVLGKPAAAGNALIDATEGDGTILSTVDCGIFSDGFDDGTTSAWSVTIR